MAARIAPVFFPAPNLTPAPNLIMLKNLFRPKWRHTNAATRIDAIDKLHPLADAEAIRELALNDLDNDVRMAAIAKLEDMTLLKTLLAQSGPAADAARARWVQLLCDATTTPPLQAEEAIISCEDPRILAAIAARTQNTSLLQLAVAGLTDQQQLFQIANTASQSAIRQLACERLVDETLLRELTKTLINKDKGAYQVIRQKLQAIRDQQQVEEARKEKATQLLDDAAALARADFNPQFEGKLLWLRKQQAAIAITLTSDEAETLERALLKAVATLDQHQQSQKQAHADNERKDQLTQQQQGIADALTQTVATLGDSSFEQATLAQLQSELDQQRDCWKALAVERAPHPLMQMNVNRAIGAIEDFLAAARYIADHHDAITELQKEVEEHAQFGAIRDRISALKQHRLCLRWPEAISTPAIVDAINAAISRGEQRINMLQADRANIKKHTADLLGQSEAALENGDSAAAAKQLHKARQQLEKLGEQDVRALEPRARALQTRLDELHDWQHFATDPKREALCVEMEKLVKAKIPAPQKAQAIRELQDEWKSLGDSRNTQKLWQRFRKAADKAYAPCAEYFEQQRLLRTHNEKQRQHIIEQLQLFIDCTDWSSVDWKTVEKLTPIARQEWSHYTPVERANAKPLQDTFNRQLDVLHQKLNEERQRNADARAALIERARALVDTSDMQSAIEQSRQLLTAWQQTGATWHKKHQELWKQFRAALDTVHERRNQERQVAIEERDSNLAGARNICTRIRELADQDDDALLRSRETFDAEKQKFHDLGAIPKQEFRNIQKLFNDTCDYFETRIEGIGERSEQHSLNAMKELIARCETSERKDLQQTEMWLQPTAVPDSWWLRILPRLNGDDQSSAEDRHRALRLLCIKAEIAADAETPADDQALRMEFQMQRLAAGLGQKQRQDVRELASELQLQWWATSSRGIRDYAALRQRFDNVLQLCGQARKSH